MLPIIALAQIYPLTKLFENSRLMIVDIPFMAGSGNITNIYNITNNFTMNETEFEGNLTAFNTSWSTTRNSTYENWAYNQTTPAIDWVIAQDYLTVFPFYNNLSLADTNTTDIFQHKILATNVQNPPWLTSILFYNNLSISDINTSILYQHKILWANLLNTPFYNNLTISDVNTSNYYQIKIAWANLLNIPTILNGTNGLNGTNATQLNISTTTCTGTNAITSVNNATGVVACSYYVNATIPYYNNLSISDVNSTNYYQLKINHSNIQNMPSYLLTETDPRFSANFSLFNPFYNQTTPAISWVQTQNYLTSYTETDPKWSPNYTAFNNSWSSTFNATYQNWNKTYADTLYKTSSASIPNVSTTTCSGTDKVSAINNVTGVVTCTADQTGSGTGTSFAKYNVTRVDQTSMNTTYTTIPNLTLNLASSGISIIECMLMVWTNATTTGLQLNTVVTGTSSTKTSIEYYSSATTLAICSGVTATTACAATAGGGTIITPIRLYTETLRSEAGTFIVQFRSELVGAVPRVNITQGSWCRAVEL
jgi:hypothetical protein